MPGLSRRGAAGTTDPGEESAHGASAAVALAAAVSRAAFAAAEAWVEPPVPVARSAPRQPVVPPWTIDPARWREVADLEEQRAAQNRKLIALEVELARLDRIGEAEVARLTGADLTRALEAVLAAYRAGDLLGGRLPLIVEGILDGLTVDARDAALAVFARATDVQTVVVTDDPEVMQSLAREGGTLVRWPERIVNLVDDPELEPAPTRSA